MSEEKTVAQIETPKKIKKQFYANGQSNAPSKPVESLYPNNDFPRGIIFFPGSDREEIPFTYSNFRSAKDSAKEDDQNKRDEELVINNPEAVRDLRLAGEIHREIRNYARRKAMAGANLWDYANDVEKRGLMICGNPKTPYLDIGQAFPLGLSLNHVAAHWTPNDASEGHILTKTDVMKVDVGYHVNGRIVDSAFTVCHDAEKKALIDATVDATNSAIRAAGVDACVSELGDIIEEVICSYELNYKGKTYQINPVRNLSGHTVGDYRVHAGKSIPNCKNSGDNSRMEEGDLFACETFSSTGKGRIHDEGVCSHFMLDPVAAANDVSRNIRSPKARELYNFIRKSYSSLAFAKRWVDAAGFTNHALAWRELITSGIIQDYPPLADVKDSWTAQTEHTFLVGRRSIEILTAGDDY